MSVEHVERLRVAWVDGSTEREDARVVVGAGSPHTLENVGDRVIHAIVIELKV